MKSLLSVKTILFIFFFAINTAHAARDYNSSRSNIADSISAPDATDTLLKEASSEASVVTQSMIGVDQRDGYKGDYVITVDVDVSIVRARREPASGLATGKR